MAKPWEQYQAKDQAATDGPWSKYAAPKISEKQASDQQSALGRFGAGLASLADATVGSAIPFAVQQVGYAGNRAAGDSPEEAQAALDPLIERLSSPVGKAFGVTDTPGYKEEGMRRLFGDIGQTVGRGISSVAGATGIPEQDVGSVFGSVMPLAGRYATNALRPVVGAANSKARHAVNAITERGAPVVNSVKNALTKRKNENQMIGLGAASVDKAAIRQSTAESLPVPIKLTRGQLTRDPEVQQFEIETAKNYPEGAGKELIRRQSDINRQVLENFDAMNYKTGAEQSGLLRSVGKIVDNALIKEKVAAQKEVSMKYEDARASGETKELVSYDPLMKMIDEQGVTVKTKLAPVLSAVQEQLIKNDPSKTGKVSIDALEDIYQMIGKNSDFMTPNGKYGGDMKSVINKMQDGVGGKLYKEARAANARYKSKFKNAAAVDRLISNKPGTTDRKIALEDVFDRTVLKGSFDELRSVATLLKKGGEEGRAAWRELQGQTIDHIKTEITKGLSADSKGVSVPSASKLDKIIRDLDSDGKLDYLFGKKGSEKLRDLRDTVKTAYSPVSGAANYSNSASAIIRHLDSINKSFVGHIPVVSNIAGWAAETALDKSLRKKTAESLNYNALNARK